MAHPIQAAVVSALTFAVGAVVPLLVALVAPASQINPVVAATTLVALAVLGGLGASAGGAGVLKGALRVTFWGRSGDGCHGWRRNDFRCRNIASLHVLIRVREAGDRSLAKWQSAMSS